MEGGASVSHCAVFTLPPAALCSFLGAMVAEALVRRDLAHQQGELAPTGDLAACSGYPLAGAAGSPVRSQPAPDMARPFVQNGDGQPKGLTHREQVYWMQQATHPLDYCNIKVDEDLLMAVQFELEHLPESIDHTRGEVLNFWRSRAAALADAQTLWADEAPRPLRKLVSKLHGPLIQEMCDAMQYEDGDLVACLQEGFPYAGVLPAAGVAVRPDPPKPLGDLTIAELREQRQALNKQVISRLRPSEWDQDVLANTLEDVSFGAMAGPWPLATIDTSRVSLSRRLPVREERDGEVRTRVVDDKTESAVNLATQPAEKLSHDTIDVMIVILRLFLIADEAPLMWKRDIGKVFRCIAIEASHLDLSWVVFMADGIRMAAQHLALPFGTTSAVHSWHRTGAFLLAAVRRLCLAPAGRFVDDYFGASKADVNITSGTCLDVIGELVGFPCKPTKTVNAAIEMILLGAKIAMRLQTQQIIACVCPSKAARWTQVLLDIQRIGKCAP